MVKRLKKLTITEVASCAKGINQEARVVFAKAYEEESAEGGEDKKDSKEVATMGNETIKSYDQAALEAEVKKAVETKDAEIVLLKAVSELSEDERTFYKSLGDAEKSIFLKKSQEERKADIQKSKKDDEALMVNGQVVRKSVVGDVMFAVVKSQQEQIEKANKAAAAEKDEREKLGYMQKAEKEFPNLPGAPELKARVLKAIYAISEQDVRESLFGVLKSANDGMNSLFTSVGTSQTTSILTSKSSADKLDTMVKEYATKKGISVTKAYAEVLETQEGQQLAKAAKG